MSYLHFTHTLKKITVHNPYRGTAARYSWEQTFHPLHWLSENTKEYEQCFSKHIFMFFQFKCLSLSLLITHSHCGVMILSQDWDEAGERLGFAWIWNKLSWILTETWWFLKRAIVLSALSASLSETSSFFVCRTISSLGGRNILCQLCAVRVAGSAVLPPDYVVSVLNRLQGSFQPYWDFMSLY